MFSGLSFLDLPPAGLGHHRRMRPGGPAAAARPVVADRARWPSSSRCWSWSRWCRSSAGRPTTSCPTSRPAGSTRRSTCPRTTSPTRRPAALPALHAQKPFYFYPYRHVTRASLNNVLIIGSGTGNDAAVALSEGAKHVDAVEIDPVLPQIGRVHPDHPYQNPRLTLHIADGREYLQNTEQEVQPDRVRAARLAERAGRAVRPPPGELPAHRAVAGRGQVAAGPRRHVRDVQLLRAVPVQPVRHHDRRTSTTGRPAPRWARRSAAAGWPCSPSARPGRCRTARATGTAPRSPRPPTTTRSRTCRTRPPGTYL